MNTHNRALRRFRLASLATVTIAGLYACGGGGDSANGGEPPAAAYVLSMPAAFTPAATKLPPESSEYDKHMQVARIAWDQNDDITAPHWCANPGTGGNPLLQDRSVLPITEIFDNFYFTGTVSVGQYIAKTPDGGYVLFDTMNNATDVANITIPQLQSANIDPATLRGLVVSHGHGDHDGGALDLQTRYSPAATTVGSADYTASKTYVATNQVDSTDLTPRRIDVGGGYMATAMPTPGHTAGTTSYFLDVTYKGRPHKIAYWGGSGFPGAAAAAVQYMNGAAAMYEYVKANGVDASINSHSFEDKVSSWRSHLEDRRSSGKDGVHLSS